MEPSPLGHREIHLGHVYKHPRIYGSAESLFSLYSEIAREEDNKNPRIYDSAEPLFSLYSEVAKEEDDKRADGWKEDATDGILVFSGLFSASIAVLLAVSIQDLRPGPQDTSAFYLANIYQIFSDPNVTFPRTSIPSSTIATPPPFSPPRYAVWVNSLWFLSLLISLSCALMGMSLRQWAHRYIRLTRPARCSPRERARMREFFFRGVDKTNLPMVVEALPTLLHLSLFLFFTGLLIYLFNINHSTFIPVVLCIGVFSIAYGWITLSPLFWPDSPYYGPLSSRAWSLYASLRNVLSRVISFIVSRSNHSLRERFKPLVESLARRYNKQMSTGIWEVARDAVKHEQLKIDLDILKWTMDTLSEDDRLENFFQSIPGLLQSEEPTIKTEDLLTDQLQFEETLRRFLQRTLSSKSLIESVKHYRLDIYLNVIRMLYEPKAVLDALHWILRGNLGPLPRTIQSTNTLASWCISHDKRIALDAQCVVAKILQSSQARDGDWVTVATKNLGIPKHHLRKNIKRDDDSVSLAIFIHITDKVFRAKTPGWNPNILLSLSDFHAQKASSGLQNQFCALWNQIVEEAKKQGHDSDPVGLLRAISRHYIALHRGTGAAPTRFINIAFINKSYNLLDPGSYPLCNIATHFPNPTNPPASQPNNPNVVSSQPSRIEFRPIAASSTAPHQAEDVNNVIRPASSTAHPPLHSHRLPSASQTTDLVRVPPQIVSVMEPSTHESIQMISPDLIQLVSTEVSHPPSRSSSDRTANVVRQDPHPDPLPSSVSVQQQLESNIRQVVNAQHPASDITQISFTDNQISQINTNAQPSEESTGVPPTTFSESLSSPVMMSAPHSEVILSPVESAPVRPDRMSPAFGPPRSILTTGGLPSPPTDHGQLE